ncbi:MAG: hypothetical protein ACI80V_003602 [Rhodothermales bacterium]
MKRRDRSVWGLVAGAALLALGIIWFGPLTVTPAEEVQGKLFAARIWTLEHAGGELSAKLQDRRGGVSEQYLVQSVDRGDVADFRLADGITLGAQLAVGDTIGVLRSARSARRMTEFASRVSIAQMESATYQEGAKQALVDEANSRLQAAQALRDLQSRIVSRLRTLHEDGLIATDELERAESEGLALDGELGIIRAELEVLTTGARSSERRLAATKLEASRRELDALSDQLDASVIVSPIAGVVSRPSSEIALATVRDLSSWIVVVPLPIEHLAFVQGGAVPEVPGVAEAGAVSILDVSQSAESIGGASVVLVTCVLRDPPPVPLDGLSVTVIFRGEPLALKDEISLIVGGLFSLRKWWSNAPRT